MYTDHTHLSFAGNNIDDIDYGINQDLANVNDWLFANKLTLNKSKTEFMLIGSRQKLGTLLIWVVVENKPKMRTMPPIFFDKCGCTS